MKKLSIVLFSVGAFCSSYALAAVPATSMTNNQNNNYAYNNNQAMTQQLQQLEQQVAQLEAAQRSHGTAQPPQQPAPTQQAPSNSHDGTPTPPPKGRLPFSTDSVFGNFVVTGPFVGVATHYDGSDLIVNSPSIYTDYKLLQRKQTEMHALTEAGQSIPTHPHIVLSGNIEGQTYYQHGYTNQSGSRSKNTSDIDLTNAELDTYVDVSPWVNGYMAFVYDGGATSDFPNRISNSRLTLDRGFVTIGDLAKAPVFGSIGQMYVPFGRYSYSTISEPLTETLGRTKARAIDVGFHPNHANTPYATGYAFRPDTTSNGASRVNQYGVDGGYELDIDNISANVGAGYISTLADSTGMQSAGFEDSEVVLQQCVGGVNVHGDISYGPVTLISEYVTATSSFNSTDLSYNGSSARPNAFSVEGDYGFTGLWRKPMTFALGYSNSNQAVALLLPKYRYTAALTTAIMHDTLLKFEYRRDSDYGTGDTGSIAHGYSALRGSGNCSDTVTAALDIYF